MTEQDPRYAASHRLAPLVARALDDVVGLGKTVLTPLKRAIDANPELPLNLAIGWDASNASKRRRTTASRSR